MSNDMVRIKVFSQDTLKVWLAADVQMFHEQRISEILTNSGIENFVPVQKEYHKGSDCVKLINHVVIPKIIFVHVGLMERKQVLELPEVINFIVDHVEHQPVVISDKQIAKFKFMLNLSDYVVNIADKPIMKCAKVEIIKGTLAGFKGELLTENSSQTVGIYLNALGYAYVTVAKGDFICMAT
jgi:transcription termination/antitermination protein NusG